MRPPNPVPQLGQQPQQFTPQSRRPITIGGTQPQVSPEQQIQQQVHELAIEIYARLASEHIGNQRAEEPVDSSRLTELAKDSQVAAKAFFEIMGIKFNG